MPIASTGELNERIIFNQQVRAKDEYGTYHVTDREVFSCFAMVKTQFLKEIQATVGTVLENTLTFVIRHGKAITNDMTITHRGKKYQIIQINPDYQHKRYDTIIAKAVS